MTDERKGKSNMEIINLKLKDAGDAYFLDIDLDKGNVILHITNILLCRKTLDNVEIEEVNKYGICKTWIHGLFSHMLSVYGDISMIQKAKEMTLEEIEKELGYPIKIVEEKK